MNITKDKVKRSTIVSTVFAGVSEYLGASVTNDFELFKNYKFNEFSEALNYTLTHPVVNMTNAFSNELFHQIQPFILGSTLLVAGKILFDNPKSYEIASDYGAYGTSRWAKDSEIFNKEEITTNMKKEGTLLARHKKKPIILKEETYMNKNVALVGGSGAGKTRANIIPNILKNKTKSLVVIDPKGELYEKTSQLKREQGYDVHLVNFKNRSISDRYNLFDYIRRDADAFKIAQTMASNSDNGKQGKTDFFDKAQISVLQSLILYVKHTLPHEQQHMGSVLNLAGLQPDELKELFEKYPRTHIVRKAYQQAIERLQNEKTMGDVFASLMQTLNPWQYEDVCQFTAANDFLFEELGQEKKIVYVILPIADNEFKPIITTFFTQMFSELYRLADNHYGELPNKIILELDEFANVGKIPNFEERLSTTRSLGIEVTIVLQDISQLERVYGKDIAKEIINNCDTRLLLKANEPETAKYFSQMAGKTTIRIKNKSSSSSSKSSSSSESTTYVARDLITSDEVSRLGKNDQLLFLTGQYPMKIRKAWFDEFSYFRKMLGKRVSTQDYPMTDRGAYKEFIFADPVEEEELLLVDTEESEELELDHNEIPENVDVETGEIMDDSSNESPADEPEESDDFETIMKNFRY